MGPCAGLAVTNAPTRAFHASDPVWAELPPEGPNAAVRVCCWELAHETPGAIGSGPRATPFDSPYPLSSPALRKAFHRAKGIGAEPSAPVTVRILPTHPLVGLYVNAAPGPHLRGSSGSTNDVPGEVDVYPPSTLTPSFDHTPDGDDAYTLDATSPDEGVEESPAEDDDGGCGDPDPEKDDCDCADDGDGTSQCSFRLRISLGSPTPGENAGFVWTSLDEPTAISPAVFNVLGTDAVTAATNALGEFTVTCSAPGGRTVQVANIEHGVALTVWNASGRLENRWEVTNPDGNEQFVRCRKLTILGNAVSDETFDLDDGMYGLNGVPDASRVADTFPDECVTRRDATRGVFTIKSKWRTDPDEPDFVTDVHDETVLEDWTSVSSVMSEFVKVGVGSQARRRLARRYGYDEKGPFSEEMAYWCDFENSYRHARLRSVRSDRRAWSFHDYDAQGRETARLEQLDGSPFPDGLVEVSHLAELPEGCSAKATVTSYEPPEGDSRDRNDAFLPRRRDTWVMRAGTQPVLVGTETWLYTRTEDADGIALRTCVHASGVGDTLRTETTVAYPEDYSVPKELRGRTVSRTEADGVTETSTVEKGTWDGGARAFTPGAGGAYLRTTTRRASGGVERDTYDVSVEDALRRLTVFRATCLTSGDAVVAFEESAYDDIDRLRSTTYHDGTSLTNAYSCCRLLWWRDRQNRTTLRSAQTGTDHLYNAYEEIWITNLTGTTGVSPVGGSGVSPLQPGYRITQHFYDALGRETNTVTYAGSTPGEAAVPIGEAALLPLQGGTRSCASATTTYTGGALYGYEYSIHTDERGAETWTWINHYDTHERTLEETLTNGMYCSSVERTTQRNGATTTRRSWYNPDGSYVWTEERRFTEYAPNGYRIDYVVTTSSDHYNLTFNGIPEYVAVTNSVSTYDLLGRLVTTAVPAGGSGVSPLQSGPTGTTGVSPVANWLVTSNAYDGATSRILTSTRYAPALEPRTTTYLYNAWGEQVGTVLNGITNRTDTTYEADASNIVWRVETSTVIGPSTNSLTVTRTQLTGLSDSCRRHTITISGTQGGTPIGEAALSPLQIGATTESLVTYDPATGIETETITSSTGPTIIRRSLHGVLLSTETTGETTYNSYDAFARVAQTARPAILAATGTTGVSPVWGSGVSPLQAFTYSPAGDLLATHTYTNATDFTTESYAYDLLGNRISTTDAHGNTIHRTYDPFGRILSEWGATYPVRYTYDTQNRRTSLTTFRTTGGSQLAATDGDTTTWTYDPYTSLCLSKIYADGSTITYTYTPDNLPLRTTYPSGKWKENVYDAQRRLCGVVYSSSDMDYELQLDDYGNATNVQDAIGNSWRYEYGFDSQLLSEEYITTGGTRSCASASTNRISRSYDFFDRSIGYTLTVNDEPKGGVGYAYDADGRLSYIAATNSAGRSFAVAYTNNTGYNYGYTLTTPFGNTIRRIVDRDDWRRSLVTNCVTYFNSSLVDSNLYAFDALSRPTARTTSRTGCQPVQSAFSYNNRSEVVSAAIGTNYFTHVYDDIGNHLLFGDNAVTNMYTHNNLNQITTSLCPPASPRTIHHNADGGLSSDGIWSYAYDAEGQLTSVTSSSLTNGAIRVLNSYDYRRRRTSKTVQRLNSTIPPPPAPPTGTQEWQTIETRTFVYDDWNLIHETIYTIDGGTTNTTDVQYFWGLDLSDSLQGAGGVGGLLAVSRNGRFYFPVFDNNGNVTKYVNKFGNVVAAYEYDDFGRTISQSGSLADFFRHRFSTKYNDPETSLSYYGFRFYAPDRCIWINIDPMEEEGGLNLYGFCRNRPVSAFDVLGQEDYCRCFQYTVSVMRRYNWESPWYAVYRNEPVGNRGVVQWNTKKFLGINLAYVEQITVKVLPKVYDCFCGKGKPLELNYRPRVFIDGPFSPRRADGKLKGEAVWEARADISGKWTYDTTAAQNVVRRKEGTRISYTVTVEDGYENTCGTMSFVIVY
ncbi:MAG: RHS repeat-associated core domain-containing protein [Kiritimatiellae bacterium]|nr:RHS repeat-associated core domain-containing protein [Kiritimatiellia bacterium]